VAVADGDTVTVLDASNTQWKIRLMGIDAPEKKQAFGSKSKESLSALVFDKSVSVEYSKRDKYGRILLDLIVVYEDGATFSLNERMVETGNAVKATY